MTPVLPEGLRPSDFPARSLARSLATQGRWLPGQLALTRPVLAVVGMLALCTTTAAAHPMTGSNATFVQSIQGPAVAAFLYLGAKHMVTGYDHLLFLVGVIFFLYRLKDVVLYVSLFTIGHSITLLGGVLGGIRADAHLVDAVIGASVAYKAFENLGGFEHVLHVRPNTKVAVLIFGLFHGFGLATKLQEFTLSSNGLVTNIVSFNVGVEIGQMLALTAVLILLTSWRARSSFMNHAFITNTLLMTAGFVLAGYQLAGYFVARG